VHRQFERFWLVGRKDAVFAGLSQTWPLASIKLRIEVVLRNLPINLIEDLCALVVA